LERGTADRRHPARNITLATMGAAGPEVRTVILRAAGRSENVLEMHTDGASPKAAQIAADPRVALHVWIPKDRLQIRLRATATLRQGDPDLFGSLPPEAQANYGGAVPGGEPQEMPAEGDPDRFTVIRCKLHEIDALRLSDPHRRALYAAPGWQGRWIAP
jgi:hypothetical protein